MPTTTRPLRTLVALTAGSLALAEVLPAAAAASATSGTQLPPVNPAALRQSIAGLPDQGITAALVSVSESGGSWRGASGTADLATGRAASPDMRFRIGSVTKVFTAVVVLQLAAEHRVDLGTPVQHYLPGVLPADFPPITVAELLDHRTVSGRRPGRRSGP